MVTCTARAWLGCKTIGCGKKRYNVMHELGKAIGTCINKINPRSIRDKEVLRFKIWCAEAIRGIRPWDLAFSVMALKALSASSYDKIPWCKWPADANWMVSL